MSSPGALRESAPTTDTLSIEKTVSSPGALRESAPTTDTLSIEKTAAGGSAAAMYQLEGVLVNATAAITLVIVHFMTLIVSASAVTRHVKQTLAPAHHRT